MGVRRGILPLAPLVVLLTAYVMTGFAFGRYLLSLLAPDMIADGVFGYDTLAVMTAANQVGYLAFSLLGGMLTRVIDPKPLVVGSVGLTGALLCALGFLREPAVIAVVVAVLGALTATTWVPMVRLVQHAVDRRLHGSVLGIVGSGTAYGTALTGVLVPVINTSYGWSASWLTFGAAALALMLAGLAVLPRAPRDEGAGRTERDEARRFGAVSRKVIPVYVMMFLSGGGLTVFLTYFVPYMRADLGFSASFAGFAWSAVGVCGMASGVLIGQIADRTSVRAGLIHGHLVMLLAVMLALVWPGASTILVTACAFGLSYFGTLGMFAAYVAKTAATRDAGATYGIGNLCLGTGAALFNYLGGTIKAETGSFDFMFIASCLAAGVIIVMALRLESDRTAPAVGASGEAVASSGTERC